VSIEATISRRSIGGKRQRHEGIERFLRAGDGGGLDHQHQVLDADA